MSEKRDPERVVREIKRKTLRRYSAEEKIRIVLEGMKGEDGMGSVHLLIKRRAKSYGNSLHLVIKPRVRVVLCNTLHSSM